MALLDDIIGAESGGNATAKNPRSSATGAGQFIDSTWLDVLSRNRPDLVEGRSRDEILALRRNPDISREMTQAYANENSANLARNGIPANPGNVYLSHFAGPGTAVSLLKADPSTPVPSIMESGAIRANPFLANMTVGDLRAWASNKMGMSPGATGTTGQDAVWTSQPSGSLADAARNMPMLGTPLTTVPDYTAQQQQTQQQANQNNRSAGSGASYDAIMKQLNGGMQFAAPPAMNLNLQTQPKAMPFSFGALRV